MPKTPTLSQVNSCKGQKGKWIRLKGPSTDAERLPCRTMATLATGEAFLRDPSLDHPSESRVVETKIFIWMSRLRRGVTAGALPSVMRAMTLKTRCRGERDTESTGDTQTRVRDVRPVSESILYGVRKKSLFEGGTFRRLIHPKGRSESLSALSTGALNSDRWPRLAMAAA
jgi:hypothetical protein